MEEEKKGSSSSANPFECKHKTVIEKIKRGQELVNQLRDAVAYAGTTEPVNELFNGIQNSLNNALSAVQSSSEERKSRKEEQPRDKLRRRFVESSMVTTSPHYDGHDWRKYGEKNINGAEYERCYYRCTYSKEQKCPATKTIQQENGTADPPLYLVTYYNRHICNHGKNDAPIIINSSFDNKEEPSPSNTRNHEVESCHVHEQQFFGASSTSSPMDVDMMKEFDMDTYYYIEDFGTGGY